MLLLLDAFQALRSNAPSAPPPEHYVSQHSQHSEVRRSPKNRRKALPPDPHSKQEAKILWCIWEGAKGAFMASKESILWQKTNLSVKSLIPVGERCINVSKHRISFEHVQHCYHIQSLRFFSLMCGISSSDVCAWVVTVRWGWVWVQVRVWVCVCERVQVLVRVWVRVWCKRRCCRHLAQLFGFKNKTGTQTSQVPPQKPLEWWTALRPWTRLETILGQRKRGGFLRLVTNLIAT